MEVGARPRYIQQQDRISEHLDRVWNHIYTIVEHHFGFITPPRNILPFIPNATPELVRIMDFVAIGGINGRTDWEHMLNDPVLRRGLVAGIIGKVVMEHVFSPILFGTTLEEERELHDWQFRMRNWDVFARIGKRVELVRELVGDNELALGFHREAVALTINILILLEPILQLDPAYITVQNAINSPGEIDVSVHTGLLQEIWAVVSNAAWLSTQMRLDPLTLYYFHPLPKDSAWDPDTMEMVNVIQTPSPPMTHNQALVKIVCFPRCVAYKKGGFPGSGSYHGLRSRQLSKAQVALRVGIPTRYGQARRIRTLSEVIRETTAPTPGRWSWRLWRAGAQ